MIRNDIFRMLFFQISDSVMCRFSPGFYKQALKVHGDDPTESKYRQDPRQFISCVTASTFSAKLNCQISTVCALRWPVAKIPTYVESDPLDALEAWEEGEVGDIPDAFEAGQVVVSLTSHGTRPGFLKTTSKTLVFFFLGLLLQDSDF